MLIDSYNTTLANAINGFFLPIVTDLYVNTTGKARLNDLMIRVGRIQVLILGLVLVGFIILGREFINLSMGSDFEGSYYIALLLILPGIVILTLEIPNTLLLVIDKLKFRSYLNISGGIVGIIISILLSTKLGALGAGIGIFIGSVLFNLIGMNIIYWKRLKLNIPRFLKDCHLNLLVPILLSLIVGFIIQRILPADDWLQFALKVLLVGSFYIIIMWLVGMNSFEKQLIVSVINRILPKRKQ